MTLANPHASRHNLITVGTVTIRPLNKYHWLHISQLVAPHVIPALVPYDKDTLTKGSLTV